MKVCMILMSDFTHDARVTKEAKTLADAGHKVKVYALKSKNTLSTEKRDNFEIIRTEVKSRYILPKGQFFFFLKYIEFLLQIIRQLYNQPFDIYHAHDLETLPIGFIISKLKNKPLIYDSHELYIDSVKTHRLARPIWYQIEKFLATRTSITIMETQSRGKIFAERYNVAIPEVIMNCQYLDSFTRSDFLRELLPIPVKNKILIYQGKVEQNRGVDILLEVMDYVKNASLVIIGPGTYLDNLRKKVKQTDKQSQIFILDPVPWEELSKYTASADLGVFPLQNVCLNYYLSLSNKLFEYLSAGIPVVFSDFPEMRKIIVDNKVGTVINEKDPVAIADSINNILNNQKLYEEMSKNARRIVKEKYNWHIEGRKLLNFYDKLNLSNS